MRGRSTLMRADGCVPSFISSILRLVVLAAAATRSPWLSHPASARSAPHARVRARGVLSKRQLRRAASGPGPGSHADSNGDRAAAGPGRRALLGTADGPLAARGRARERCRSCRRGAAARPDTRTVDPLRVADRRPHRGHATVGACHARRVHDRQVPPYWRAARRVMRFPPRMGVEPEEHPRPVRRARHRGAPNRITRDGGLGAVIARWTASIAACAATIGRVWFVRASAAASSSRRGGLW